MNPQPVGVRVKDLVKYAKEILATYDTDEEDGIDFWV
jgi:hypothetical protein